MKIANKHPTGVGRSLTPNGSGASHGHRLRHAGGLCVSWGIRRAHRKLVSLVVSEGRF